MEKNELIVIEKLNPVEIYKDDGMTKVLTEIETKATSLVNDVSTASGRKVVASNAYAVARCKVLLDDIGKELVSEHKKEVDRVNAIRKTAREFLDSLKEKVRQPLTEWEAEEKKREAAKAEAERQRIQDRVDQLAKFGRIEAFHAVAKMPDDEYGSLLALAQRNWQAEQDRIAAENKAVEEEAKRLAEEKAEMERQKKENIMIGRQQKWFNEYIYGFGENRPSAEQVERNILLLEGTVNTPGLPYNFMDLCSAQLNEAQKILATRKAQAAIDAENMRIRQEQEAKEAAIRAEQAAIEAEKRKIEDDAKKAAEIRTNLRAKTLFNMGVCFDGETYLYGNERSTLEEIKTISDVEFTRLIMKIEPIITAEKQAAAKEARIKAEKDAKEKAEREAKEKADREKAEAEEKARQEALRPDKEKLSIWLDGINFEKIVGLVSEDAKAIYGDALCAFSCVIDDIRKRTETL